MNGVTRRRLIQTALTAPLSLRGTPTFAAVLPDDSPIEVDVALVLATDVSPSVDQSRWDIQRSGCSAAFRSPAVIDAITSGDYGRAAVTFVEWANPTLQTQAVGWRLLDGPASANDFAAEIEKAPRMRFAKNTSISGAIAFSDLLLAAMPYRATRKVIDVSGDGVENSPKFSPLAVQIARQQAIDHGVVVNGLAIVTDQYADLQQYYQANVVGGLGSFAMAADDWDQFPIADRPPSSGPRAMLV
jgi:hypothetical protein